LIVLLVGSEVFSKQRTYSFFGVYRSSLYCGRRTIRFLTCIYGTTLWCLLMPGLSRNTYRVSFQLHFRVFI